MINWTCLCFCFITWVTMIVGIFKLITSLVKIAMYYCKITYLMTKVISSSHGVQKVGSSYWIFEVYVIFSSAAVSKWKVIGHVSYWGIMYLRRSTYYALLELFFLYKSRSVIRDWFTLFITTYLTAFMQGKYLYSLIWIWFFIHTAKLQNLSEVWSCLYMVNGSKWSLISLSFVWGRSSVFVRAIRSLLKILKWNLI